jgi:hypothetical protein
VAQLEVCELAVRAAGTGVGGECVVAQPVRVGDPQLRAGVWSLPADDDPHPSRPGREVHQAGGLDDPGPGTGLAAGVQRGLPVGNGQRSELVDQGLGQPEPDRVGQPLPVKPVQELVGGAGAIDPDQDLAAGPVSGLVPGQLT